MERNVIYTVVFGDNYKLCDPLIKNNNWRYLCFTDKDVESTMWEVVKLPKIFNSAITSRYFKQLFYLHFESFISIYVDGNLRIVGEPDIMLKHIKNNDIAFYNHNNTIHDKRDCIYDEARACIDRGKDKAEKISMQMDKYIKNNYPSNNGLICGGVIIRRNTEAVRNMMNRWFNEVLICKRDQLSWNYLAWKHRFSFTYINENIRNNNFVRWERNMI